MPENHYFVPMQVRAHVSLSSIFLLLLTLSIKLHTTNGTAGFLPISDELTRRIVNFVPATADFVAYLCVLEAINDGVCNVLEDYDLAEDDYVDDEIGDPTYSHARNVLTLMCDSDDSIVPPIICGYVGVGDYAKEFEKITKQNERESERENNKNNKNNKNTNDDTTDDTTNDDGAVVDNKNNKDNKNMNDDSTDDADITTNQDTNTRRKLRHGIRGI